MPDLQKKQSTFQLYLLTPLFGVAGLIGVVLLADARVGLAGWKHHVFYFLGNASYAIYLWHLVPRRVIVRQLGAIGLDGVAMRPVAIAVLVGSGLAVGAFVYRFVEKPMLRALNALLLPRRMQSTVPAATPY